MKPAAIIQARMGSTRLPGKALLPIEGHPMLWHVVERVRRSKHIGQTVIATTDKPQDDVLAEFAQAHGLGLYRGSEQDVLDRFYQAAVAFGVQTIVRITPDCPLLDPQVIDTVIGEFLKGDCDYATNTLTYTYPEGLDVEVFSSAALERAWKEAKKPSEREHVTPYIRNHPELFRIKDVRGPFQYGAYHWSVDEAADLEFVRAVYRHLYRDGAIFGLEEVVTLLKTHPELAQLNANVEINAGYQKSLQEDASAELPLALDRSMEYLARAERVIPGASQTFSKAWTQFSRGTNPVFLRSGKGCRVTDVDGNRYIDYTMALAPVILGYAYPEVDAAIQRQLADGISFTLPHPLEVEVSEVLTEIIPCAEMVRFGKNGSDSTSAAIRVARAFTNRDVIACCGYHGWQDWYIGTTTRHGGVPDSVRALTAPFVYNQLETLAEIFDHHAGRVAAVILEPIGVLFPEPGFLEAVRDMTHHYGALLIFDEIITGFRMALGGAQERFGVTPDLAAFGKSMGNGMPISAVVGRRDVMKVFDEIFFSMTFGGETLSLAASLATLFILRKQDVVGYIWKQGQQLMDGLQRLIAKHALAHALKIQGYPARNVVEFLPCEGATLSEMKSLFQQESARRGVLFSGSHNLSFSHTEAVISETLAVYDQVLACLRDALSTGTVARRLKGRIVEPVFRKA